MGEATEPKRGEARRFTADPDVVLYAFSNRHFADLVRSWREEVKKAGAGGTELDLGPWYRRMLVKAALGHANRDHITFVRRVAAMAAPGVSINIDSMRKAFEKRGRIEWGDLLLRYAWKQLYGGLPDLRRDLEPMHSVEFQEGGWFTGANAPFIFTRRLLGLPRMRHWSSVDFGQRGDFDYKSDERSDVYERVQRFLSAAPGAVLPCLVVHSDVYQRGLSALAGKLARDDLEEPGFAALPRCLLYASPHSPPHKGVDLAYILAQIRAFYAAYRIDDTPAASDADVRRDMELVRTLMSRYPATFIIDGVQDVGPDLPDLRAAMLDDPVRQLLGHLVYPDLGRADEPSSPEIFNRNRFVILANGPCNWLAPMVEETLELPPPSSPNARQYIQSDGAYRHGARLKRYYEACASQRGGEEPFLQCADALLTIAPNICELPPLEDLAAELVERVAVLRPDWFLPLLLLVITPGGLRPQTLFRLVRGWEDNFSDSARGPLLAGTDFDAAKLLEFTSCFSAMIIPADDHTLMDAIPHKVSETRGMVEPTHHTLTFLSPRTAELLLMPMLARIQPRELAQIHILLAEESMRQHTKHMRLVERDDHNSVRVNRRLLQAIYHGLMALDFSQEAELQDTVAQRPAITKRERFGRIYSMFYRMLLEAPPHWELSRVMGAAPVKRDLLRAMLAAQHDILARSVEDSKLDMAEPPTWLLRDVAIDGAIATIANDLYTALCKTMLQLNDLEEFDQALSGAETILAGTNPRFVGSDVQDDLLKVAIDAAIVRDKLVQALMEVRRGLGPSRYKDALLSRSRKLLKLKTSADPFPLRSLAASMSCSEAARAISLVQRWAEILATSVDPPPTPGSDQQLHRRARRLEDAYILFTLADALRWAAFVGDPFSRGFVPSGHAARVQIRVLMLQSKRPSLTPDESVALRELARHRVDTLTRTFVRYPAERASMMILEAILDRAEDSSAAGLLAALESLITADRQMLWAMDKPRLRMRLLFERAKVLGRLAASTDTRAPVFARWARFDIERLKLLANTCGSPLWLRMVAGLRIPELPEQNPAKVDRPKRVLRKSMRTTSLTRSGRRARRRL